MKKLIIAISCCTVVLLLGYASYRGYRVWKQSHWMSMAKDFAAKKDGRNQMLCLQQVLRLNLKNVEACRMMADVTEAARSPSAIEWRQRVVDLNPKSTDDRLALAKTALVLGQPALAATAVEAVDATAKKTASYHNLAGMVAVANQQATNATSHFKEAAQLEPWNATPQLNLAVLRLRGTNTADLADARNVLKQISATATNSSLRCQAMRELVVDAMRFDQNEGALAYSAELVKQTNSVFRDRLLRLDVLRETKAKEFKPALAECQRDATKDDGKVYELANWQMTKLGATDALAWLKTLPETSQTNQSVALLMAECRTMMQDWRGLQISVEKQNWDEWEFMRHAFLTRALRGQDLAAAAKAEWGQARQGAINAKEPSVVKFRLGMLLQFAARWNWLSEAEEILWTIVNQYPDDQLAFRGLAQTLYENGRTRPLMNLFTLQAKRRPTDLGAKNNLTMTALLLNAQELKPHEMARDLYQKSPTNAAIVSTYAFSLHLLKQDAEALKVMQQLPAKELENPAISGYYGLILKATGNGNKGRTYLDWALKRPVLPEEKKLFEQARL